MRSALFQKFGRVKSGVKLSVLKSLQVKNAFMIFNHKLSDLFLPMFNYIGDETSTTNIDHSAIDQRIKELIDMEDSDVIFESACSQWKNGYPV